MSESEQLMVEVRGIRSDIREDIRDIHLKIDSMARDCGLRHDGVNLQKLSSEVDILSGILQEVTAVKKAGLRLFDVLMAAGMFIVAVIGLWGALK